MGPSLRRGRDSAFPTCRCFCHPVMPAAPIEIDNLGMRVAMLSKPYYQDQLAAVIRDLLSRLKRRTVVPLFTLVIPGEPRGPRGEGRDPGCLIPSWWRHPGSYVRCRYLSSRPVGAVRPG